VTVSANTVPDGVGSGSGLLLEEAGGASLKNSILAGNSGAEDCAALLLAPSDAGNNLVQTQDGCGFTNGVNGTIVGQDPLLGALRDNGGPTRTHALQIGSPAIDAGDTDLTTDQRGEPRPGGPADDIGAFEEEQLGTITVVKESFVDDPTDFPFSLKGGNLAAPIDFYLDTSLEDLDGIWYSKSFPLGAGAYTITETPVGSTGPVAIECEDDDGPLGSFTGDTADVSLTAYQHVTCTFTNGTIYSVTATAAANGSVSCSPSFVGKGGTSTCTAMPEAGYRVKEWTGACASWGSNLQCYLSKITEENVSTVSFEQIPPNNYTVHATVASGLGTVSCDPTLVSSGGTSTCTATPDDGFRVSEWTGACQDESAAGTSTTCQLTNITGDKTSTVAFEAQTGSITIVKEANPQSEQEFAFLTNIGGTGTPFTLVDNGSGSNSTTFNDLPPAEYDVTEQLGALPTTGWTLDSIVCSGGSDITIVEESANVQIRLSGGEDVTCTFNNERTVGPGPGGPEPIPAVSLWGLGLLSLLLAAVGWSRSR
jgi:hypothetical protein